MEGQGLSHYLELAEETGFEVIEQGKKESWFGLLIQCFRSRLKDSVSIR